MKTLRNLFFLALIAFTAFSMQSCNMVTVDPGTVAILVDQPWFFGHEGVRQKTIKPGRTFTWITTDDVHYSVVPTVHEERFENIMTSDNNPVSFTAYIKLSVDPDRAWFLHDKFLEKWYENNIQPKFRTKVRDKACVHQMFALTTDRKISVAMENELVKEMQDYVASIGLPVKVQEVNVGTIKPQPEVLNEIAMTAAKVQNKKTQDAEAAAQVARQNAERERANADKTYQREMGLSTDQYIQLQAISMYREAAESGKASFLVGTLPGVTIGR
jgi:regulator of protease activity HflC (stomatin/prohibitin superfamily)